MRLEPVDILFDASTEICIEGVLQIPNTTFTLTLYDPNGIDPFNQTQTFQLDNIIDVGTVGTNILLSTAINQQQLLAPNQAINTGQRVRINGNLIIDQDYTFGFSVNSFRNEIVMAPGSSIEIQANNSLTFFRSDVHGCGDLWDRINVLSDANLRVSRSEISDADVAIEMQNNSNLTLLDAHFTDNNTGIGSFGPSNKNIRINTTPSPWVTSRISNGQTGCIFENTNNVIIQGFLAFRNLEDGIILDGTSFIGSNLFFFDVTTGCRIPQADNNFILNQSSFTDCNIGISGTARFFDVSNSDFNRMTYGILKGSQFVNEESIIENCFTDNCNIGIYSIPMASTAEVQRNRLWADFINVAVQAFTPGDHQWAIQHNDWIIHDGDDGDVGYNVYFAGTNNARIFRNLFNEANTNNYLVLGGERNIISFNEAESEQDNIGIFSSPMLTVSENYLQGFRNSLIINNNCTGSDITCNLMTSDDDDFNLSYGTGNNGFAATGRQILKGNAFDESFENDKAINWSPEDVAQASQYLVGFNNGQQGNPGYPFFDSFFSEWFNSNPNPDKNCIQTGGVPPPPGLGGDLLEMANANIELLDSGIATIYNLEIEFDTKLKLYRALDAIVTQGGSLNTHANTWYTSLKTGPFDEFIEFENIFKNAIAYTEAEANHVNQLKGDIKTLKSEIDSIEWVDTTATTSDPIVDLSQRAIYKQKLLELKLKIDTLGALIQTKNNDLVNAIPQLTNKLNQIGTLSTTSGQNLKSINQYLIQRINASFNGFTAGERLSIKQIADQCIGDGGEGVIRARGLLADIDKQLVLYNDECIPVSVLPKTTIVEDQTLEIASIFPNPANEEITIILPRQRNYNSISIINLLGKQIDEIQLQTDVNQFTIDVNDYPQGIYFISSDLENAKKYKFTIVR